MKDDPIDVCSDSESEEKEVKKSSTTPCGMPHSDDMCRFCIDKGLVDIYSIDLDGMEKMIDTSEFSADVFLNEYAANESVVKESKEEQMRAQPELNVGLHLEPTHQLRKAKRRMEDAFANDYTAKI